MKELEIQIEDIKFEDKRLKNVKLIQMIDKRDINLLYAEYLLSNDNFFQYLQDKTNISNSKKYLVRVLQQKIKKMHNSKLKNDGVIMPFLSFQFIKKFYDVEILYLYSKADLEKSKFGADAIFVKENTLFIVEYKSSKNKKNEENIFKIFVKAVHSLYGTDGFNLSTLDYCRDNLETIQLKNPKKIIDLIDYYEENDRNLSALVSKEGLSFNVCIITPIGECSKEKLKQYIIDKYLTCNCNEECKKFECIQYKEIKLNEIIHIQLYKDFNLEQLYNNMINLLEIPA